MFFTGKIRLNLKLLTFIIFILIIIMNIKEFRIEGTRAYPNRTCLFTYNSENVIHGSVNSPRYPDSYPLNIKCEYVFDISSRYERILLTFREFKLWSPSGQEYFKFIFSPFQLKLNYCFYFIYFFSRPGCNSSEDHLSVYQSSDDYHESDLVEMSREKSDNTNPEWILLNRYIKKKQQPQSMKI